DARDCAWSPSDFPGALTGVFGPDLIEATVSIATLEAISPGLTSFDASCANDLCDPARYSFMGGGESLGGSITGATGNVAICINRTTGQTQVIPLGGGTSWDCGVGTSPGDDILMLVRSTAN
ncbi:MAG: hypothetical protein ACE5JX_09265, partial [Acidobacteriota bacterium]